MKERQAKTEEIAQRNRAALMLLHEAAQAISDGELDYARRLQRHAARGLSSRWGWPLTEVERFIASLRGRAATKVPLDSHRTSRPRRWGLLAILLGSVRSGSGVETGA